MDAEAPKRSVLYVWGYNDCGQTAHGRANATVREPSKVAVDSSLRLLDIACGLRHTAAVASDGSLFTWGSNEYGQLGDGTEEDSVQPMKVKALRNEFVHSVACGAFCTAAIADSEEQRGRLWVWGQNQSSNRPRLFSGAFKPDTIVAQVACGQAHVLALSADGVLQAWGYNEYGQLGRGSSCEGLQRAQIISSFVVQVDDPPVSCTIKQVTCGEYHSAAIAENGDVYTWGKGTLGRLGHRTLQCDEKEILPRRVVALQGVTVKQIAAGGAHTCAVSSKGELFMWGVGQAGQLGLGPHSFSKCVQKIPVLVISSGVRFVTCGTCHTLVSMRDGRLLGCGYNCYGQAAASKPNYEWYPSPIDWCVGEVKRLAAGGGHSAVLTHAYTLKELCELKLTECIDQSNALTIEDAASRMDAINLARFCMKYREGSKGTKPCI